VVAVSWMKAWRVLNLVGFAFTFGVGTAWGLKYYRPEMFATVEPFLVLFFIFYVAIGLLYVLRQTAHRRPWVDGSLVFGTPLLAFPLQAGLLKDDRLGLAFSALAVSIVYLGLLLFLRKRQREQLLTEAYAALAIGFATLAVPLAFNAGTTAGVWALEGVAIAWLGLRQHSNFRWLVGLGLQLLAAGAFVVGFDSYAPAPEATRLLLNPQWLGAAILSFSGFALALIHDRHRNVAMLPALLFAWAVFWWGFGGLVEADRADLTIGGWQFAIAYLAITAAVASLLRVRLAWPRLSWLIGTVGLLALPMVFIAEHEFGAPLQPEALPGWAAFFAAMALALWQARDVDKRSLVVGHLAVLWTIALAVTLQAGHFADTNHLAQGWYFLALVAPVAMLTLALWRLPAAFAWPRAAKFGSYAIGWFAPALFALALAWVFGLFAEGDPLPLPYVPLLNPLELSLSGIAALLAVIAQRRSRLRPLLAAWPFVAFAFVTMATLRAVHHLHGEPWGPSVLDSGFSQSALTLVWSVIGVGAWIIGSRKVNRPLWMGGAVLMGVVLLKLITIDRQYMGDLAGIISFVVVGLLMVGVGYIAPTPPKQGAAPVPPSPAPTPAPAPEAT
jgi:uncharacterized membrane protein